MKQKKTVIVRHNNYNSDQPVEENSGLDKHKGEGFKVTDVKALDTQDRVTVYEVRLEK